MKFLEPAIFIPCYFKDIVGPFIKKSEGNYHTSQDLLLDIESSLSERDRNLFRLLNIIMGGVLCKNKNYPLESLKRFTDYTDINYPHPENDSNELYWLRNNCSLYEDMGYSPALVTELFETLAHPTHLDKTTHTKLEDIFNVSIFKYTPVTQDELLERFGEEVYRYQHKLSLMRGGLVVLVNYGFGDIMLGNSEYNKMELIENVPEFLYRAIMEKFGDGLEEKSFLSVTRLM